MRERRKTTSPDLSSSAQENGHFDFNSTSATASPVEGGRSSIETLTAILSDWPSEIAPSSSSFGVESINFVEPATWVSLSSTSTYSPRVTGSATKFSMRRRTTMRSQTRKRWS